ncbi:MAG: nitroreductase family deazaflavin-dependent oxidoreductase [Gaiellaceae bacterium]
MAQSYRLTRSRRLLNVVVKRLAMLGLTGKHTYLLTVKGRKTGRPYSTPVTLVEDGGRWLVAPYGEVGWVKNARAAGMVTLRRGRRTESLEIHEVDPAEAASVLRAYVRSVAVTRPFFDAGVDSPLEAFQAEAPRHPVFRI